MDVHLVHLRDSWLQQHTWCINQQAKVSNYSKNAETKRTVSSSCVVGETCFQSSYCVLEFRIMVGTAAL